MAMTHGGNIFAAASNAGVPWQQVLDFSASINPLGPSPRVREAILAALDRIAHYPDKTATQLRLRLAERWGVAPQAILCGNGATDLLANFCVQHPPTHLAVPCFNEFHRVAPNAALVPLEDPGQWPHEGTLVITRPANPTGFTCCPEAILSRPDCTILVDESFLDFTTHPSLIPHTAHNSRLYVLRSLTKFQALPGLRIGALIGRSLTAQAPWSVNALAEQAAIAALDDQAHAEATRQFADKERVWLQKQIEAIPFTHVRPSVANYLYIETPHATALARYTAARNILIRDCTGWPGLPNPGVRIAIRPRWESEALLAMWKEFVCSLP
ncbi:MAG: aminotransferase class I/II-fold pyridoxal phosphate-dependent enzyme [Bryobacterales bacterium]|nr:aminotransferase class I/II-fold pyridoxal phosphate-dependent enzyme [Bryobacterales bacterium]